MEISLLQSLLITLPVVLTGPYVVLKSHNLVSTIRGYDSARKVNYVDWVLTTIISLLVLTLFIRILILIIV